MSGGPVIVVDAVTAQFHNLGRYLVERDPGVLSVFLFLVDIILQLGEDDILASHQLIHFGEGQLHHVVRTLSICFFYQQPESSEQVACRQFLCYCLLTHDPGQSQSYRQSLPGSCHVNLQQYAIHESSGLILTSADRTPSLNSNSRAVQRLQHFGMRCRKF